MSVQFSNAICYLQVFILETLAYLFLQFKYNFINFNCIYSSRRTGTINFSSPEDIFFHSDVRKRKHFICLHMFALAQVRRKRIIKREYLLF